MSQYKLFQLLIVFTIISSCSGPTLNGHYHLIWNDSSLQFQTWNIKDNVMVINDDPWSDNHDFLGSLIEFEDDSIGFVWVDSYCKYQYRIDDNGTVIMKDDIHTLLLVPHNDCQTSKSYLDNKFNDFYDSLPLNYSLVETYTEFPKNYENELLIGLDSLTPVLMFNNNNLSFRNDGTWGLPEKKGQTVWTYINKNIPIQTIIPIIYELHSKGYKIEYAIIQESENYEQISLTDRSIVAFSKADTHYDISYCENCLEYRDSQIDSIIKVDMISDSQFILNNDTTDLFSIEYYIKKYIIKNRTTRLNSEIQILIDGNISFESYLELMGTLSYIHMAITKVTNYYGKNDPDAEWILKNQSDRNYHIIENEFPLRVKEKINIELSPTAKNLVPQQK
ncbi:hypothetical protein [Chondrinema litorale]|uniref:hypothetical protein n=1 Tax=Chondrinema litorale TaxID=2994555 RepID=UPI002542E738|nr:hypothetical protein [Chondrinema litorale]UZR97978.1 hypothetical protein OQ292_28555 [Chondrinema litorale]